MWHSERGKGLNWRMDSRNMVEGVGKRDVGQQYKFFFFFKKSDFIQQYPVQW